MNSQSFVCATAAAIALLVSQPSCGSVTTGPLAATEAEVQPATSGLGDPCMPAQERDPTFSSFTEREVSLETDSPGCLTGVCLVNHFRGRVSCPYGQAADGSAPNGASSPCHAAGSVEPVTGAPGDRVGARVLPQCADRTAEKAVYCSCRCANADGRTDDGSNYCPCSEGFECKALVARIGIRDDALAGSYCIKKGSAYAADSACSADCDPLTQKCE